MRVLYAILMTLALPALLLAGVWRILTGSEPPEALAERLGLIPRPDGPGPALWLHGASLGELTSVGHLLDGILAARPGLAVLVTANTATARAMVAGWQLPGVAAALAPFDAGGATARLIRRWTPTALIIVENELWPGRVFAMRRAGHPVLVVGARLSPRSARRWGWSGGLIRAVLQNLTWVSAQDADSLARLTRLGLPTAAQGRVLDLKALVQAPPAPQPPGPANRAQVLLAASTHDGEEPLILRAFAAQQGQGFSHLILAPRHPGRGDSLAALIAAQGLAFGRRSNGDLPRPDQPVFLADTLGEMQLWYPLAGTCLIGGTFAPKGGHTPYEPARHAMALLHGPSTSNFAAIFARLDAEGGALAVTKDTLAAVLTSLTPARQTDLAQKAADILTPQDRGDWIVPDLLRHAGL